jgi:hypothetical protein
MSPKATKCTDSRISRSIGDFRCGLPETQFADDKTKSPAQRAVDKLSPLCVDAVFHTCLPWGISDAPQTPEAEREFAKNFDVGDTYFKGKNYKAAESRFREALEYKPDDPDAT